MSVQNNVNLQNGRNITFISWNVRGVNNPVKRGKVLSHLKKLTPDIIFLQETHLKDKFHIRLKCRWIESVYHSSFPAKARGTAIMIKKSIPFVHKNTISDKDGRYLIVIGELFSIPLTLLNIYAPNMDNPSFFKKVMTLIPDMSQTNLIIGGDFNCVLDPYLDRSSTTKQIRNNSSVFLNTFIDNSNLSDVWRIANPTGRDYSFFSTRHNSYTRIDYFLLDAKLMPHVIDTKYHNIVISDHCPVTCTLNIQNATRPQQIWRFNPLLLGEKDFQEYLKTQISLYFDVNDNSDTTPGTLWEAFKAYLRGVVISFESAKRKRNRAKLLELDKQIKDLDKENAQTPSNILYKKILSLKYDYNNLLSAKISKAFLYTKQKYFELGDKPHKILARQLRKQEQDRTIHKIINNKGEILTNPKDINNQFLQFYKKLYATQNIDYDCMKGFLDNCTFPNLEEEELAQLNSEITIEEIKKAIASTKNNKAPGPDGIPSEFYKKFSEILCPYLHKTFTQALVNKVLPPTLTEATITVIYKKGRNAEEVGSYRPISLLNLDGKLFSKILANRLSPFLTRLVHPDQTGFIPQRNSFFNLRRLFNIIYSTCKPKEELAVLALDAEKAFDQVEWPYLFEILEKFKLGANFISMIKLLYVNPCARVLTNQILSPRFDLHRGTKQGCPLSPLIFALAVEPLAESIRSDPTIFGYDTNKTINKISLYADDVLLYITRPEMTIPALLEKIKLFGSFSGYRINLNKSELMPIHVNNPSWLQNLPVSIAYEKFTYLGIQITKCHASLLKSNFSPLLSELQSSIQFWNMLPISLIGRVNAIKMIILPKILYLFQNLPVFLPKSYFKKIHLLVLPFLWGNKTHRIARKHLCKFKKEGGLALPNFLFYYWATHIKFMSYWLADMGEPPAWLQLEQEACQPYCLGAMLLSPLPIDKSLYSCNVVIHSTIRIFKQMKLHFKLKSLSLAMPIADNPSFKPSILDNTFRLWRQAGLRTISDLYQEGVFASFNQIQEMYKLPGRDFFRYLQIRDYVRKYVQSLENLSGSCLDKCLQLPPRKEKLISRIYENLMSINPVNSSFIKSKWEAELGITISDIQWEEGLENVNKCSYNARHCLIQFKVLHRLHFSKERLHKIYPDVSPICDKCSLAEDTLSHSLVFCSKVQKYWTDIFDLMSRIIQVQLKPDPLTFILGISSDDVGLNNAKRCFVSYGIIIAKKLLLTHWKKKDAPPVKLWLNDLVNTLHLEKIRYTLSDRLSTFNKIWAPLSLFLQV